jgi:hypothetical protein
MTAVLYRMFDADGNLLYVGCTMNILSRTSTHVYVKPWAGDIALIRLEHFADRDLESWLSHRMGCCLGLGTRAAFYRDFEMTALIIYFMLIRFQHTNAEAH